MMLIYGEMPWGGAAESLDPLTLLMASGGDGGSSSQRSEMDGIAIRLQMSNGIPIQVYNVHEMDAKWCVRVTLATILS